MPEGLMISPPYGFVERMSDVARMESREAHLYVPERFVLGYFREVGDDFAWNKEDRVLYIDDPSELEEYERRVREGHMEVLERIDISSGSLERLMSLGRCMAKDRDTLEDVLKYEGVGSRRFSERPLIT